MAQVKTDTQKDFRPGHIGIIGMGPVGLILAVHLQEAGRKISLCDTDKIKINLIRNEGIKLEGILSKQAYFKQVCSSIAELMELQPETVVISLKANHLKIAAEQLKEAGFHGSVICAMNGIDSEEDAIQVFGESSVLRMVINFAGNLHAPNVAKVTFFNPPNYIASMDDSQSKLAHYFADLLTKVNTDTDAVNSFELLKRVWEKTILNASLSALCGVGRMTIKEAMDIPDTVEVVEQTIEEAVEVALAEKIKFEDDFIRKCLRYLRRAGNHFPSLAVDLLNNRPTEIDYMNGKIVEYGRKHYIRTPLNLSFTNMVKAIGLKNSENILVSAGLSARSGTRKGTLLKITGTKTGDYFLGIDLGSAYTKFTVISNGEEVVYQTALRTVNRDRIAVKHVMDAIRKEYHIVQSCATGYGRKHFPDADLVKTEINCAAAGVSKFFSGDKNIIDIGGEDIKVIRCDANNNISNFYLNDKCAAGTGSFITEISERAGIPVTDMSDLAAKSNFSKELNSFCTVFAKTEIMGWLFEGLALEDIARGIYISIINRVSKLRIDPGVPVYLIGGVVAHHPYLAVLLKEKLQGPVSVLEQSQFIVSAGAALYAKENYGIKKSAPGTESQPEFKKIKSY